MGNLVAQASRLCMMKVRSVYTAGGDARPTESFHNLRVGQKPMND